MNSPIRLLLVDDEERVRKGLRMCMAGEDDFEVIGEAEEGADAIALSAELGPDVIVLDLRMDGMDGLEAASELRRRQIETRVVVLSMQDDSATRGQALASGADAFVAKQEGIARLFEVIREVASRKEVA